MRLALLQSRPQIGPAEALATLDAAAARAADAGADILITPEMFMTGYNIGAARVQALAEPADGAMAGAGAALAQRHGIAILYGFPLAGDDGSILNAVQFVSTDGSRLACCAKTHLYADVDRAQFAAGGRLAEPFAYRGWRLALAICYDIEFPEVARALALAGAEAILVPTANMEPFRSVATRLVPARAEENAVFIAYANYCSSEAAFDYCGLSCVVGPDGEDIARAGTGEDLLIADISKARLAETRRVQTHLTDRRPELYA